MAAAADVLHLVSKGITQSLSVFLDTIVICSCTAFSILLGDVYTPRLGEIDGIVLTQQSRASHMGAWSSYPLAASTLLFAFSSIIYSDYLGENAIATLKGGPKMLLLFRLTLIGVVFLGCVAPSAISVFFFADPPMEVQASTLSDRAHVTQITPQQDPVTFPGTCTSPEVRIRQYNIVFYQFITWTGCIDLVPFGGPWLHQIILIVRREMAAIAGKARGRPLKAL